MTRFYKTLTLLLCVLSCDCFAQNRQTDSLQAILNNKATTSGNKVMALCELADIMRYRDADRAKQWADQAVVLALGQKNISYRVYAYSSRAMAYLIQNNFKAAEQNMDTCMQYVAQVNDDKARSLAWYRKGRQLRFENKTKEVVTAQLRALQYIKGKGYWKEESAIYYSLYGAYSTWEDLDNQDKYALLALQTAEKSHDPNKLCEAWQAVATAVESRYQKTRNKIFLDSALQSNKRAIEIYQQHESVMLSEQFIAIPSVNLANIYNRYFPVSPGTTDSIRHYASTAFNYAVKAKDIDVQAAVFGIYSEDAQRNKNYDLAETYLVQALSLLVTQEEPNYYILASVHEGLSSLEEKKGDYKKALEYYKAFKKDHGHIYDSEQAAAGKELEAKYQAREKEQEIKYLKDNQGLQQRQKYLYTGIAIALIGGLLFMFRSYYFRLRYSLQREKTLEQQKEEARLLAKLREEEAMLLELEKQKAELYAQLQEEQAKLKAEEAARLQAEQETILAQKEVLQKEVLAGNLHVEQKNKVLQELKNRLEENPGKDIRNIELNKMISQQMHFDSDFEELRTDLKEILPDFYNRLQAKAENKLTTLDLKYCAYIFLKRSTKEMANLLGVEPKSIRMSKYRLKQKLGLGRDEDLEAYIASTE